MAINRAHQKWPGTMVHTISEERAREIGWPDTDVDRRAWEQAKIALGPDATSHALLERAQEIKEVLKREAQ
jgi:hypothetical protein